MNPITDPIKDTLVPLRTNFNANGSVRSCTSLNLNLFHWPMGKNSGNGIMGFVGTFEHSVSKMNQPFQLGELFVCPVRPKASS